MEDNKNLNISTEEPMFNMEAQISSMLVNVLEDEEESSHNKPSNNSTNDKQKFAHRNTKRWKTDEPSNTNTYHTPNSVQENYPSFKYSATPKLNPSEFYASFGQNYYDFKNENGQKLFTPPLLHRTPLINSTRKMQMPVMPKNTVSPNVQNLRSINPINNLIYNIRDNFKTK